MYLIENDHAQRNEVNERVWFCAFSHSIHVAVLLERECKRSRLLQRARLQLLVAYSHDQAPELPITHRSSRLLQYQYLNVVQVRIREKKNQVGQFLYLAISFKQLGAPISRIIIYLTVQVKHLIGLIEADNNAKTIQRRIAPFYMTMYELRKYSTLPRITTQKPNGTMKKNYCDIVVETSK
jgi:hypothetical protein